MLIGKKNLRGKFILNCNLIIFFLILGLGCSKTPPVVTNIPEKKLSISLYSQPGSFKTNGQQVRICWNVNGDVKQLKKPAFFLFCDNCSDPSLSSEIFYNRKEKELRLFGSAQNFPEGDIIVSASSSIINSPDQSRRFIKISAYLFDGTDNLKDKICESNPSTIQVLFSPSEQFVFIEAPKCQPNSPNPSVKTIDGLGTQLFGVHFFKYASRAASPFSIVSTGRE